MKVLHIIPMLAVGGAEIVLEQLISHSLSESHKIKVLCFGDPAEIGIRLAERGIEVQYLEVKRKKAASLLRLFLVNRVIADFQPDIIQTWMYHANLLTGWLTLFSKKTPIVWAIHQDISDKSWIKTSTMLFIKLGAFFSAFIPKRIVIVSERAVDSHIKIGYQSEKFRIIHNGFDVKEENAVSDDYISPISELDLEEDTRLIGFFARFHEMKDHRNFLAAAQIISRELNNVQFILAGGQVDDNNSGLVDEIRTRGLSSIVHLLGQRKDIPQLLADLDIYSISSRSEGFPLSVGEAMAAGVPCVVTDVGDAAKLVGETGMVVPPKNPESLAEAWIELLAKSAEDRRRMGREARKRIQDNFSLDKMVADYYTLYDEVLGN